ncbi:HAD hydrolase-like protein [Arthrobacter sp. B10-11]|uniref:HAD hydrolase-like protein n=1 Tax=Arthrobacter sp. B10-11 TaxID=3081160 RepID=UPI002955B239|nr:HAD hydrolase-like protein [Arthrobacter sp. B10-11]MDV8149046.1 HAD hydrolase-like protein [Arthrobacter sp. B10-11]
MIRLHLDNQASAAVSCILFDMDGTLLDSAPGVMDSAARALKAVNAPVPPHRDLLTYVGPPMYESFRHSAGLDAATAREALRHYRAAYAETGAGQSSLFDGIAGLLNQLGSVQCRMAVATSKVEDQAVRLARAFGIDRHFVDICGASDAAGRASKEDVIAEALARLKAQGVDISSPVMVGDRSYDVAGAAVHGIPTIFVSWGYGDPSEAAEAAAVAGTPEILGRLLRAGR